MHGYYIDLLRAFKGERLNSVFSPDGTLISASAAPHCGVKYAKESASLHEIQKGVSSLFNKKE